VLGRLPLLSPNLGSKAQSARRLEPVRQAEIVFRHLLGIAAWPHGSGGLLTPVTCRGEYAGTPAAWPSGNGQSRAGVACDSCQYPGGARVLGTSAGPRFV